MIYSNGAQVFRGDISGVVEQAKDWEQTLIGLKVMPMIQSPVRAGQYPIFNLAAGNLLRNEVKARAPYGTFARGTRSYDQGTFAALEYGFEEAVDDTIAADMARFFNAEVFSAKQALRKVLIGHEIRVAAEIMNTQFTATAAAVSWTGTLIATMDAAFDIQSAIDRLMAKGIAPIALKVVLSYPQWTLIRKSTIFQNRLRGAGISSDTILNASLQAAAEVFGVDEVCIGRATYDAGVEGQAFSSTNIWGNTYAWVGKVVPGSGVDAMLSGGAGYTINWSEYGPPTQVFTYRDEPIKSNIVRSCQFTAEKTVDTSAGELITTSYSAS